MKTETFDAFLATNRLCGNIYLIKMKHVKDSLKRAVTVPCLIPLPMAVQMARSHM